MIIRFTPECLIEGGEFVSLDDHVQTYELRIGEEITDLTNGVVYTIDNNGDMCESKI